MSVHTLEGPVFRPLVLQKGQATFLSHFTRIMAVNEGANGKAAYAINNAGTAYSSWSFGNHQYDVRANSTGRELIKDILQNATDPAGKAIIDPDSIDHYMQRMMVKGDSGSLSYDERLQINRALQSDYGMDAIDKDFIRYAADVEKKVFSIIDSIQIPEVKTYLSSHVEAQLFIADVKNQFGVKVNAKLVEFLQGQEVQLPDPGAKVSIVYPFGFEDLSAFAAATGYAQKPRGAADILRRQQNILDEVNGKMKLAPEGRKLKIKDLIFAPKSDSLKQLIVDGFSADRDLSQKQGLLKSAVESEIASSVRLHVDGAATASRPRDPLALDLDSSGRIDTIENDGATFFDFDGNGFAESVGWVGPADGFVVRDLNKNGVIDNGAELFGDETVLPDGKHAGDGFQALATLDSNGDGVIDRMDLAFDTLLIWQDLDSDGRTDPGELLSMAEAGVAAIALSSVVDGSTDKSGNVQAKVGDFVHSDGRLGVAASFVFPRDTINAISNSFIKEAVSVRTLPDLAGFGTVYSLHEAMTLNHDLEAAVLKLSTATSYASLRAEFESILFSWTGAAGVKQDSRGTNIDARKLAVVEAFYGQPYIGTEGANPIPAAATQLLQAYNSIFEGYWAQFLSQSLLRDAWDALVFDSVELTNELAVNYQEAVPQLLKLLGDRPSDAVHLLYEFAKTLRFVEGFGHVRIENLEGLLSEAEVGYAQVIRAGFEGRTLVLGTLENNSLTLMSSGVLFGLGGSDILTGSRGDDTLVGGDVGDVLRGGDGVDTLYGNGGNDTLDGDAGDDILFGGPGDDRFNDTEGRNTFEGGSGNDTLGLGTTTSFWGPNLYVGGEGDDTIYGSRGPDTYVFSLGDGSDVIRESPYNAGGDVLTIGTGLASANWTVSRVGTSLVMTYVSNERITFESWFDSTDSKAYRIDRVAFADGAIWLASELTERALTVYGTAGTDVIQGLSTANDILHGMSGDDVLRGYGGDDSLFGGEGGDQLYGGAGQDKLFGGEGGDYLDGEAGDDYLSGGAGDDRFYDTEGSNTFDGGDGNDTIMSSSTTAFFGPNAYIGGRGDDVIYGSRGSDTYIFNLGDGQDTIQENPYSNGGDVVKFGAGILANGWTVSRAGTSLVVSDAVGRDKLTFMHWFDSSDLKAYRVDRFEFADGTVWTNAEVSDRALTLFGTVAAEFLRGSASNDIIHGLGGADTIHGYAGADKLYGDDGDDIIYGGEGADSLFGGEGADRLDGEAGNDYLSGGAGADRLYDTEGSNTFDGGDGDDWLMSGATTAFWGPNIYIGGKGNDTIFGSRGGDTYVFGLGDGQDLIRENPYSSGVDIVKFGTGVDARDFAASRVGSNLVLTHSNGFDKLTFQDWFYTPTSTEYQVERFEFSDGSVLTGNEVVALVGASSLVPSFGASVFI